MRKPEPAADLFTTAPVPVAPLDDAQRLNCLRLIRSPHVGPASFRALINQFGSAGDALAALPELAQRGARGPATRTTVYPADLAERELEAAARIGATPVFTIEPGYPAALAAIDAPPPMLYVRGCVEFLSRPAVAVVGSRDCSAAGIQVAHQISHGLAEAGYVIVSGLARGIDGAAHKATLQSGTIAVLAGGLDHVYPPEHANLMRAIGEHGVLISEQPPGFRPRGRDFPRRNRIISGVALGVVIVEAAARSGTLVTARFAAEQGREVFAVPGHPLDPRAAGTNRLIQNGATLVTSSDDITNVLSPIAGFSETPARPFNAASDDRPGNDDGQAKPSGLARSNLSDIDEKMRQAVWSSLGPAPVAIDSISRATGIDQRQVQIVLFELDLAGQLARPGPGLVTRNVGPALDNERDNAPNPPTEPDT